MSWRTVVIANRCKLDYSQGCMVCRGEETTRIHLSEIGTVMVETTAVSLTASLLCQLVQNDIKVIFCDECYNPCSELIPYTGCHDASDKFRLQLSWNAETCSNVWTAIIGKKIEQQAALLRRLQMKDGADMITAYRADLLPNDSTNREGMAARIYFNNLFDKSFNRSDKMSSVNAALNYGYAILLSAVNREIAANGYSMMLGLHHYGATNPYNLSSDIMEPFRPVVDELVYRLQPQRFSKDEKRYLQDIVNVKVLQQGEERYFSNAIEVYVRSVFKALNERDPALLICYSFVE